MEPDDRPDERPEAKLPEPVRLTDLRIVDGQIAEGQVVLEYEPSGPDREVYVAYLQLSGEPRDLEEFLDGWFTLRCVPDSEPMPKGLGRRARADKIVEDRAEHETPPLDITIEVQPRDWPGAESAKVLFLYSTSPERPLWDGLPPSDFVPGGPSWPL